MIVVHGQIMGAMLLVSKQDKDKRKQEDMANFIDVCMFISSNATNVFKVHNNDVFTYYIGLPLRIRSQWIDNVSSFLLFISHVIQTLAK